MLYFNQSALFIGKTEMSEGEPESVIVRNKAETFSFLVSWLSKSNSEDVFIDGYQVKALFRDVKNFFVYLRAAGGLVVNQEEKFLFIKRLGVWDLPKGKIEKDEKPKICAKREVEEETGISGLQISGRLPDTYHIYLLDEKFILKKTYWYKMKTTSVKEPVPQTTEDISLATWLDEDKALGAIKESYRSLKDTLLPFITN